MNFGLLISFRNSSKNELSYSELYRKHIDLAVEAEDLGYDPIWLTGHHVGDRTPYHKPVQNPPPALWIGARSRWGTERAARNGYHLAGTGAHQAEIYREALRTAGRDPATFNVAQLRFGFIGTSRDKAWNECEFGLHYLLARYGQWIAEAADVRGDERFAEVPPVGKLRESANARLLGGAVLVGTPDETIAQVETISQYATHLPLGMARPGIDPKKVRASMKLFADKVIPHFRRKSRSAKRAVSAR